MANKKCLRLKAGFKGSRLLLIFLSMFILAIPVLAKKDKTKKKVVQVDKGLEPDAVCHKAKPDSHPRPLDPPAVAYFTSGGAMNLEGYDISHYQGNIDWDTFASDPNLGFLYVKATEGASIIDNKYSQNINEARKRGIKVGTYHFFRANNSAREQFANFKRYFDPHKQDLLPVVDVEVMPNMTKARFDACLEDFIHMIEHEYGRSPIIYTGKNFYNKYFHGTRFASYKFWIATYADEQPELNGNDDYLIWQYSAKGKVRGIKGYVDKNRFVGRHVINEIKY